MSRPGFHYSKLETSKPLQRIYDYLQHHIARRVTTREIAIECRVEAVSTWISSLNKNLEPRGEHVECEYMGETRDGGRLYGYRLVMIYKEPEAAEAEDDQIPW